MEELQILICLIFVDYITGVGAAIIEKRVNSTIGRKGIMQKIGIFLCVILCTLIDNTNLFEETQIQPLAILFFTVNECFSIVENLGKMNVPIPNLLVRCLEKLREKNNK